MKPVEKGPAPKEYTSYQDAKSDLVGRLGPYCCYCETHGDPTALDVEHIYPKKAHPQREKNWDNFLIACRSCNSKKNAHLGPKRQRNLNSRFLWPHLDNTSRAFDYLPDGTVHPEAGLPEPVRKIAEKTIDLVGFLTSPAKADDFESLSIAYTGVSIRKERWAMAELARRNYLANPTPELADSFATLAATIGYFSVWMAVFHDRPEFRQRLILAFRADPQCFDNNTQPIPKGRV